jgi:hypothetical protein
LAVSVTQIFGAKAFEGMDEKAALPKIAQINADGVITILLFEKNKETRYVPPHVYGGNFWHYYGFRSDQIYAPGYYVTDTRYFWESNFYRLPSQSLIYSSQTRSFSPANTESLGHEYGR